MKLVDILARELKAWPESWGIFCVATKVEGNDAAWFNYRNPVFKDGGWQDLGSVELWLSQEPEDRKELVVRRFEWQAAVDALNALKVVEWDGVGSPEPGCSIEYSIGDGWYPCEVRYVLNRDDCPGIALVAWCEHLGKDQYLSNDRDHKFRPARTAEQVAAEEREHKIRNAATDIAKTLDRFKNDLLCLGAARIVVEAMIDAGYCKQVAP